MKACGVIDVQKMVDESQGSLTAIGSHKVPKAAGEVFELGVVTPDPAGLMKMVSAVGVPSVVLPQQSFEKRPSPPGV